MNQHERTEYLLGEIQSTQRVIERNTDTGHDRSVYLVGVLQAILAGMAGLGDYATHASCFSPEVTQAIKELLETINQH